VANQLSNLLALVPAEDARKAPGKIEFCAYRDGRMIPACGDDHMLWTIAIGKDHTATIIMHKDDYAALTRAVDG
jgi:hypothetical protein